MIGLPSVNIFTVSILEFADESSYRFWYTLTLIEIIIIATGFMLPLTYLVLIQTVNVYKNTTTAARFGKKRSHQSLIDAG